MKTISSKKNLAKNALEISKQIGYDFKQFSLMENIIHYMRISSFVVKHYHALDIGAGNCGKSYCLKNTSDKVHSVEKFTEPSTFGSNTTGEGYVNTKNDVAFLDEISNLLSSSLSPEYKGALKKYTNGDSITRDNFTTGENCTSLYFAGNTLDEEQEKINNSPCNYSKNSLKNLPSIFLEEAMMERFIIIPSFFSTKLCTYHYYNGEKPYSKEEFTSLLSDVREEFDNHIKIPFSNHTRDVKKAQKVISALIKLIYPSNYTENDIEELYEVAEFIVNLSYGKYTTFWNTDKGKRFIIKLCLNYLPENSTIENCYFLENRILIKIKEEDNYHKIALNRYGIDENLKEYNFYMNTHLKEMISEIYENLNCGVVLKQRYFPLLSKNNNFVDLRFLNSDNYLESNIVSLEMKLALLSEDNRTLKKTIETLIKQNNSILKYLIGVTSNPPTLNPIIPDFIGVPFEVSSKNYFKEFEEKIKHESDFKNKFITHENVGLVSDNREYKLINFAGLIN